MRVIKFGATDAWRMITMIEWDDGCGRTTALSGEYCERDVFHAECTAPDEIVLITDATYGRMRQGKCVSTRPIGCHVDVHRLLAAKCSARHRCHVSVASLVPDHSQPCHTDYRSYLEASYTCIKGELLFALCLRSYVHARVVQALKKKNVRLDQVRCAGAHLHS